MKKKLFWFSISVITGGIILMGLNISDFLAFGNFWLLYVGGLVGIGVSLDERKERILK